MPEITLVRLTTVPISLNLLLKGQLKYMREHGLNVLTASAEGPEIEEFTEREGVPHTIIPMTRKITPAADMHAVYRLYRWFRQIKPDIVHTHTPKAGIVGMMAAHMAGVPHRLHTVAGMPLMETTGAKRRILESVEQLTYSCATRVYPNSNVLNEFIQQNFKVSSGKLKVIGAGSSNGIDTTYYVRDEELAVKAAQLRETLGIAPDDVVFTFVGRIVKDKGINELVDAFSLIRSERQDVHLVLVGPFEDDLDPVLPETKKQIDENKAIHAVGFQADIRAYLALTDIFTFPSYREGFPNVVLQAACFELALIVTDINGCNEIVTNEDNGLVIPPKDQNALKEAMETLLGNTEMRKRCGIRARGVVVEKYEQQRIWELLLQEYQQLAAYVS